MKNNSFSKIIAYLCWLASILLLLAIFPFDVSRRHFDFYDFLRIYIFSIDVIILFVLNKNAHRPPYEQSVFDSALWPRVAGFVILLLFNPFAPIGLTKSFWVVMDILSAIYFFIIGLSERQ